MNENEFLIISKTIDDLLKKDFTFQNFEILTGKMTELDTLIKNENYSKYKDIYEDLHRKYGNYRWINYL